MQEAECQYNNAYTQNECNKTKERSSAGIFAGEMSKLLDGVVTKKYGAQKSENFINCFI